MPNESVMNQKNNKTSENKRNVFSLNEVKEEESIFKMFELDIKPEEKK